MPFALNSVDEFAVRLNSLETSSIRPMLYASLVSASLQLLTDLRTVSFDAVVGQVDEFSIDKHTALRDERYLSFTLRSGFVDETTNALSIVYGTTKTDLDAATAIDSEFIRIDKEKGLVILDLWGVNGSYIQTPSRVRVDSFYQYIFRITYDCGLATSTTGDGKVYKAVPHWLSELSLLQAREVYRITNPILTGDGLPANAKSSSVNIHPILEQHIRIHPLAIKPLI